MPPTLYMIHASPPVRAVLMTAKAIGLTLVEKEINLSEGEHLRPEYLKINPQHTVPTLVEDHGVAIWDSHAIMTYLVSKYSNDDLYPKDLHKRAIVDQRLHFESGMVFPRLLQIVGPIVRSGKRTIDEEDIIKVNEVYKFLEAFLNGRPWMAGNSITVADYSLISSISTLHLLVPIDAQKYPQVNAWLRKSEKLPEYKENIKGLDIVKDMVKTKLS